MILGNPLEKYTDWQINALNSVLLGNETYFYRKMCRYISQNFNIPLPEVEKMPVDYVLLHYFESTYEGYEEKELLKLAKELCAPDIASKEEEQIQAVIADLEKEQEAILNSKSNENQSLEIPKQKEFNLTFDDE